MKLDLLDPESPWGLAFDHRIPGMAGTMALSSMIMNTRKTDMSDVEFYEFERQLDNKFSGGVFDPKAIKLEYWRRHSRP